MKRHTARRLILFCSIMLLGVAIVASTAHAWDPATHAYMEERMFKKQGLSDEAILSNRIYGSYMIDIFNNYFTEPYVQFSDYLHDPGQQNFMKLWDLAKQLETGPLRAFAYGFVSHNNTWGMDSTAHISGITYGRGTGYVHVKAQELSGLIGPTFQQLGLVLSDDVLHDVCHYLVEAGVDFLVRSLDPSIGNKIMAAAYFRSDEIPGMLVTAYRDDLSALSGLSGDVVAQMITESENAKRQYLMGYGWAMSQENALDLVAAGLAHQGVAYLASQGYPPIPEEVLTPIAKQGIIAAMSLCAGDFEGEVRATTGWVNGKLSSNGVVW
jgi:hypothetical protein